MRPIYAGNVPPTKFFNMRRQRGDAAMRAERASLNTDLATLGLGQIGDVPTGVGVIVLQAGTAQDDKPAGESGNETKH